MASSYGALVLFLGGALFEIGDGFVEFPASCLGQEDGYQWLKPLEGEEHPPINQKCVSEYMVIDVDRDQNVQHYFSSFDSWHYALRGPALEDSVNWEEWWLPNALFLDDHNDIDLKAQIDSISADDVHDDDEEEDTASFGTTEEQEDDREEVEDILVRVRSKLKVQKLEKLKAEQQLSKRRMSPLTAHHILKPLALNSKSNEIAIDTVDSSDGGKASGDVAPSGGNSKKSGSSSSGQSAQSEYFSYILSPDCSSCDLVENTERNEFWWSNDDEYGDRTAYYMTSGMFGCDAEPQRFANCMWDEERYQCSYCTSSDSDGDLGYRRTRFPEQYEADSVRMGLCGLWPQSAYSGNVAEDRGQCLFDEEPREWVKPSIGSDGRHCVCVKPNASFLAKTVWRSSPTAFEQVAVDWMESQGESHNAKSLGFVDDVVELFQNDFERGTYRITESGTYRIMEDIEFDFNAHDVAAPNVADAWWPLADQSSEYPGSGSLRDEYFMGFFAGITVEADSVVIDLNGHTLAMSMPFYLQQRFFSVIALKSVVYPSNQGPGQFGSEPVYASSVVIKDGAIGLSSHHGIHGHFNDDITIENVHIFDFETHGIEMSQFSNLKMRNIEIGPSSTVAFLNGMSTLQFGSEHIFGAGMFPERS